MSIFGRLGGLFNNKSRSSSKFKSERRKSQQKRAILKGSKIGIIGNKSITVSKFYSKYLEDNKKRYTERGKLVGNFVFLGNA